MLFTPQISPLGGLARPCRSNFGSQVIAETLTEATRKGAQRVPKRDWTVGTVTMPQKPAARPPSKTRAARYRSQHHDMQSDFPRGVTRCRSGKINPDIASSLRR